jgi:hypothetical protein
MLYPVPATQIGLPWYSQGAAFSLITSTDEDRDVS